MVVVATVAGTGRKWVGLGVVACLGEVSVLRVHMLSRSASGTNRTPVPPFLSPTSSRSVSGGCFPDMSMGLVATTAAAGSNAARVDGWWKSSSEHERAGVLQRAEQTKTYCCLVITLYHLTAFL